MTRWGRVLILLWTSIFGGACIRVPQTVAYDPDLPRTVVDGYAFHTERFGRPDLPPLIVIHGGPGGDMHYLSALTALQDEYFVLFYDQRGTGLSPREDPQGHTIDRFLADLEGLVQSHAASRPVRLVGHSWGAMLAAAYTARHPERVSHVVLAEPGMLDSEGARAFVEQLKAHQSIGQMIAALPAFVAALFVRSEDGHERFDYVMTRLLGSGKGPPYQCAGDAMPADSFRRGGYRSFDWMLAPILKDPARFDYRLGDGLQRFPGRALWLSSECSFIGYDHQEKFHRRYFPPRSEHVRLAGAGHNMFTIRPEAAIDVVRQFLRR